MYRYKLTVQYDGSDYYGVQRLNNHASIQKTIEKALKNMTAQEILIYVSGRTDKGVHALGQVIHFDLDVDIDNEVFKTGLNRRLPEDIRIVAVRKVSKTFHARHDAKSKVYEYVISKTPSTAFSQRFEVYYPNLDTNKLKLAANMLVGTHDFQGFSVKIDLKPTVKTIFSITVKETKKHLKIRFHGNSFLRYQVRRMVGLLVEVASDKKDMTVISEILTNPDQLSANKTAPAKGLFLVKVNY